MSSIFAALYNFFFMFLPVSVGNHTNYSGGGGGGSTHYSGGGSGSGSGFFGGLLLGTFGPVGTVVIIIIVLIIIFILRRKHVNLNDLANKASGLGNEPDDRPNPEKIETIVNKIKEHDKNFSRDNFLSWAEQVFVQLQDAWEERDWKKARPFESEALFNTHKAQLDDFIKNGTINIMDNVCVNKSFISDYYQDADKEYLTVFMETRYKDYIIKEDTKQVVEGNPNTTYTVKYKAKFVRTVGVETGEFSNKSTTTCPNCGAPVDVNAAGQCAYCGTVITDTTHDWVLCDLDDCGQTER